MKQKTVIKALLIYFIIFFILETIPFYNIFPGDHPLENIFHGFMSIFFYGNKLLVIILLYIAYKAFDSGTLPKFLQQKPTEEKAFLQKTPQQQAPHTPASQQKKKPLKYPFLIFIGLLCVSGLIGIITLSEAIESGSSENLKLLFTTLIIDFYLLMSLAHIRQLQNKETFITIYTRISLGINVLGCIFSFLTIWDYSAFANETTVKIFTIFMVISFCLAHIALLITINPKTVIITLLLGLTMFLVIINGLYLVSILLFLSDISEDNLLSLAILSIFVVLGSVITPLLNRIRED